MPVAAAMRRRAGCRCDLATGAGCVGAWRQSGPPRPADTGHAGAVRAGASGGVCGSAATGRSALAIRHWRDHRAGTAGFTLAVVFDGFHELISNAN